MNDDFKIYLKAIIDDSSLSDVEKKLAKERLKISADIDLKDFAKNKADIEKQFQSLAGIIKNILGDAVSDRQATQWAKQYYREIESGAKQAAKEQSNIYITAQKELRKLYDLRIQYAKLGSNKDTDYYYGHAIKKQEEVYRQARANTSKPETWDFQKRLELEREELILQEKLAKAMNTTATSAQNLSQHSKIQLAIDTEKYTTEIFTLQQQLSKFGVQSGEIFQRAQTSVNQLESAYENMKSSDGDKRLEYEKEYQKYLETSKNLLKQITSQKTNELIPQGDNRRITFIKQLNDYLSKNTAMASRSKEEIQSWIKTLESADDMTRGNFDNLKQRFQNFDSQLRSTGKLGLSWTDKLKQAIEKFGGWSLATGTVMAGVSKVKGAITELKDLSNILTEISKTSNLTKQELQNLGSTAFDSASELGRTASDYLSSVEEMSRSGFYGTQGEAMAREALLAQTAGDMTQELASKYVIATNAAYKFGGNAEKINEVLDGMNSITNRNSVAMTDMAEAMSEAGTVASSYRVSVEDLSAMIGTIESVTKSGGSEVGNSLKSLLINLQNINSSKIVNTLDEANASMTEMVDGTEKLRDPITILRDLAKTFNELDEADPLRAEILTNVAGKYQAAKLAALLQNMDMVDKMLVDYSEGAGSAMQEAEKSANNWTGSLNKLSNAWIKLINSLTNQDAIISVIDGFTGLLNTITSTTDEIGVLMPLLGGGGIAAFIKNFDWPWNKGYLKIA